MSQYISSFLIEPVARQVRRVSRSAASNETPEDGTAVPAQPVGDSPLQLPATFEEALVATDQESSAPAASSPQETSSTPHGQRRGSVRTETAAVRDSPASPRPTPRAQLPLRRAHATFPISTTEAGMMSERLPGLLRPDSNTMSSSTRRAEALGDLTLPEDDGMGAMRKRILAIQQRDIPTTEKSRLIYALMMEQYTSSLANPSAGELGRPHSPESSKSHGRSVSSVSHQSNYDHLQPSSPPTSRSASSQEIRVSASDIEPTYWMPPPRPTYEDAEASSRRNSLDSEVDEAGEAILGCQHYKRNVKIQCTSCARWYTCRFCHDEVEDHRLIRHATQNMLCMACGAGQPAGDACRVCGKMAAWYYCDICKLWDNEATKKIYHCDDCGICRLGEGLGKDFFHCTTCNTCLSISIRETHRCIERSTDCDCPICGEYLFASRLTVVFMPCGHSIHKNCYDEHKKNSFKCPLCSRSLMNMEMSFGALDRAIAAQPMPPQFRDTRALVTCNDCRAKSAVPYHWLGVKCANCDSYNTARLAILSDPAATPRRPDQPPTTPAQRRSRENSRGRQLAVLAPLTRRTAASASIGPADRAPAPPRAASAQGALGNHNAASSPAGSLAGSDAGSDDELDFWGGSERRRRRTRGSGSAANGDPAADDDDSEEESSGEEDDDLDMESEEDSDDEDPMEILGHR